MEMVKLQSEDGVVVPISRSALKRSQLLFSIADDELNCGIIKLQTVTSSALVKVVEFLEDVEYSIVGPSCGQFHITNRSTEVDDDDDSVIGEEQQMTEIENQNVGLLRPYDKRFLESMSIPLLIEVGKAADYLLIERLFIICFLGIANQLIKLRKVKKMTKLVQLMRPDPPARSGRGAEGCFGWLLKPLHIRKTKNGISPHLLNHSSLRLLNSST